MADPFNAADAMVELVAAQKAYRDAREARRLAIRAAARDGASIRDIAKAAACSHEAVRKLTSSEGQAMLLLGSEEYVLTEDQVEMLIYKLAGSARGAFPKDIELLDAGTGWLGAAGELATAFYGAQADDTAEPITLDERFAFALYQVLRLTYTGRPTVLSRLYDALFEKFGKSEPHVISAPT